MSEVSGIDRLLQVCDRLRDPGGCPWDAEQTRESLRQFAIEEAFEVVEAIDEGSPAALREELGDLLFQVVFHAKIGKERGEFDFDDVAAGIADKLIRRHPHVFEQGDRATDAADAYKRWERIKAEERREEARRAGVDESELAAHASALRGIPEAMPALLRAQRTQDKAARTGFDWPSADPVWAKVDEELGELRDASASGDATRVEEELGDLLFSVVNLGRHLGLVAEDALRAAVARFTGRFQTMERAASADGKAFDTLSLEEMDALWERAKGS